MTLLHIKCQLEGKKRNIFITYPYLCLHSLHSDSILNAIAIKTQFCSCNYKENKCDFLSHKPVRIINMDR